MSAAIDLDHLRRWEGKQQEALDELSPFPARALAAAINRPIPSDAGDFLPVGWQWLYFLDTPTAAATGPDGHPKLGEFLPPAPLPRRMWAAGKMSIQRPLRIGTPAKRLSTIKSVEAKSGKTGALVFVTVDHAISQNGELCITEEQNLVYRELPSGPAALPPGEPVPDACDWVENVVPDPVLLFRFSALTYNGHRIHYDRTYAVEKEFYPALVVHGPLSALLLADLCQAKLPYGAIREFHFRAVRPAFDSHGLQLAGKVDGNQVQLWSAQQGQICMTAGVVLS